MPNSAEPFSNAYSSVFHINDLSLLEIQLHILTFTAAL